jgi:hypothetical protein
VTGDVIVYVTGFTDSIGSARATRAITESRRQFLKTHAGMSTNTDTWVSLQAGTLTATTTSSSLGDQGTDTTTGPPPATPPAPGPGVRPEINRVSYNIDLNGWNRKTDYGRDGTSDGHGGIINSDWELLSDILTQSGGGGGHHPCGNGGPEDPPCPDQN